MTRYILANDANLPLAEHIISCGTHWAKRQYRHAQLVDMISGRLSWQLGADTSEIGSGDSILVAGGVPHGCWSAGGQDRSISSARHVPIS